ncbi:phosphotransferase enzyme family protein [Saccharibacillus sp. JS10]|uniref:phosphotransferase enzyme family protein n=1 Tax=Saccharibacillus sp. JS10 TaxID=2950552 RepID=UPI00210946D8|nr:phosphotransferase [Saccharibacillus sp. JS10]MCQ4085665.1 phosphotransferase [Saccharibacillus sp. JS10]
MSGTAGQATQEVLEKAVRMYLPRYTGIPQPGAKGWNNTTRFIDHEGKRYVLRVYETHQDVSKFQYEHAVLLALSSLELTFQVPQPMLTIDQQTLVRLTDGSGRYACLFAYIEGARPADDDLRPLYEFGASAGELSVALRKIQLTEKPAYRPYYELGEAYPLCTSQRVTEFCLNPPSEFSAVASSLATLSDVYTEILLELDHLRQLPHQLIHGDLNASNMLVDPDEPDRIAALLDFEFCTYDLRVMDAAVILSGLPAGEEAMRRFAEGFHPHVSFSPAEIEVIPLLMRLRKIDIFLHFLTRYWEKVDDYSVVEHQAQAVSSELKQMREQEVELKQILTEILG